MPQIAEYDDFYAQSKSWLAFMIASHYRDVSLKFILAEEDYAQNMRAIGETTS